jgi:membrane associated rhomboid family serine protease
MHLEPRSLAAVVVLGVLLGAIALAVGWPVWLAHLSGAAATLAAVVGYARWDERHRP